LKKPFSPEAGSGIRLVSRTPFPEMQEQRKKNEGYGGHADDLRVESGFKWIASGFPEQQQEQT